jgi:hypothetical protein
MFEESVMNISKVAEEKVKEQMNKKIADSIKCRFRGAHG